jgi:hypothetical protein
MPIRSISSRQLQLLKKLKAQREAPEGDPTWVDELGEKPDRPTGDGVVAYMVPNRDRKEKGDDVSNA